RFSRDWSSDVCSSDLGLVEGFHVGFKVVRGAYLEIERERAAEKGYPSPICATKAQTDATFNNTVSYILENIDNKMALYAGSHNRSEERRVGKEGRYRS